MDFPNGAPQSNLNEGEGEYMAASEITSKNEEEIIDVADEEIKDAIVAYIELSITSMESHAAHIQSLKTALAEGLKESVPGVRFNANSDRSDSLYTVLSANFPAHEKNG